MLRKLSFISYIDEYTDYINDSDYKISNEVVNKNNYSKYYDQQLNYKEIYWINLFLILSINRRLLNKYL